MWVKKFSSNNSTIWFVYTLRLSYSTYTKLCCSLVYFVDECRFVSVYLTKVRWVYILFFNEIGLQIIEMYNIAYVLMKSENK